MSADKIRTLQQELQAFADERAWDEFHSPKNLVMALSVEVGELVEIFQWLSDAESGALNEQQFASARLEIADVFIYLARIADKLGVDIIEAARHKLCLNRVKYPADRVRGDPRKSTDYS